MKVVRNKIELRNCIDLFRKDRKSIVFVPTMGALHDGHLSLMKMKRDAAVVVSIFVNPKQFSPNEDFASYPRTEDSDIQRCSSAMVDCVYIPSVDEMYGHNFSLTMSVGALGKQMCGASRINFFDGIILVVTKLFMQVQPDIMIFGEKDYQMFWLIRRAMLDIDAPVKVVLGETVRDSDGLAMSSRNIYLNPTERRKAPMIYETLINIMNTLKSSPSDLNIIVSDAVEHLEKYGFKIDYIQVRDAETLDKLEAYDCTRSTRIFVAAYLGRCRLIDNVLVV